MLHQIDGAAPKSLTLASPQEIAEAYRYCSGIVRRAAGNFSYAFLLLPRKQRRGIHALYAFCRAGDDAADEPDVVKDQRMALTSLRLRLDGCYQGLYSDRLTLALADAIRRFGFERKDFDDLLLGIESDLAPVKYNTEQELILYCYRVASTVGLLCLKIFAADEDRDREFAVELGKGMQLTNILRDLTEDRARGRLYIPASDLQAVGVSDEQLFESTSPGKLKEIIQINIGRARRHFGRARSALLPEHAGKLRAARAMGAIYEAILARIENNPDFRGKVELSRLEKLALIKSL